MNLDELVGALTKSQQRSFLRSIIERGTWTPIDSSGAGLTFTQASGSWRRMGDLVWASGRAIYPVTANGANATIGGWPFTCENTQSGRTGTLEFHDGATAVYTVLLNNTKTSLFYSAAGVLVTNAQMSATTSYFYSVYLTSDN